MQMWVARVKSSSPVIRFCVSQCGLKFFARYLRKRFSFLLCEILLNWNLRFAIVRENFSLISYWREMLCATKSECPGRAIVQSQNIFHAGL